MRIDTVEQLRDVLASCDSTYGPDYIVLTAGMVSELGEHISSGGTGSSFSRSLLVPDSVSEADITAAARPLHEWDTWNAIALAQLTYLIRDACGAPEVRELAINYDQYHDLALIIRWPEIAWDAYRWMVDCSPFMDLRQWNASRSATPTDDTPPQSKS